MKPSIPEVVPLFLPYYTKHDAWGSLHIVLDDGNVDDSHVRFCMESAKENGDFEGYTLASILLGMSKTQRLKLPRMVDEAVRRSDSADNEGERDG